MGRIGEYGSDARPGQSVAFAHIARADKADADR